MRTQLLSILIACVGFSLATQAASARIKDLTMIAGARNNQLVGYGLVTGLAGDGDKNPSYTQDALANLLESQGTKIDPSTIASKNVAAVMVIADVPPFMNKGGSKIDVVVTSIGDAKTLQGGVLLSTELRGVDRKTYAVAQGVLTIGGFSAGTDGGGGASVQKNHPTVGQIAGGATIEKEIPTEISSDHRLTLILREPDFTTAARIAAAINEKFPNCAEALDSVNVRVNTPLNPEGGELRFIAALESIEVVPDVSARIIVNERTGTIVATSRIRISSCAVSHGNLTIKIASTLDVSQPGPLSTGGTTQVTPRNNTTVTEQKSALINLPEMPTVEKVATALNSLGVTPRDMMTIFTAMKQAGALHAELIMR